MSRHGAGRVTFGDSRGGCIAALRDQSADWLAYYLSPIDGVCFGPIGRGAKATEAARDLWKQLHG